MLDRNLLVRHGSVSATCTDQVTWVSFGAAFEEGTLMILDVSESFILALAAGSAYE